MTNTEQLALFPIEILQEEKPAPKPTRIWCEFCHSNWGPDLKDWVLENLGKEHAPAPEKDQTVIGATLCISMVERGVTEPYYAPGETPWLSGWSVPYPRPAGYGGLDQLRKA